MIHTLHDHVTCYKIYCVCAGPPNSAHNNNSEFNIKMPQMFPTHCTIIM